jgi:hypothetical protein
VLTRVDVSTPQGDLLSFQLDDEEAAYLIQDIDGLDPVKATITSTAFAGVDGVQFQAARRESRNITITAGLNPNPLTDTVRGLRNRLYAFFMPTTKVDLTFYDDEGPTVTISGVVEDAPAPLFTQEPAMNISIMCPTPDFLSSTTTHIGDGMTTSGTSGRAISYPGTSKTGTVITLNVNRSLSAFTIYHQPPNDDLRQLDFSAPLVAGDVLTINSVTGAKGVTLNRGGTVSSLLYGKSPQSSWIELLPGNGNNVITFYATGAGVPYTLDYVARYGGL